MYRIDKFLQYYHSLKDTDMQIEDGVWVHAKPLPFYHGELTKGYWIDLWHRFKDAKEVFKGNAVAVTWKDIK